MNIYIIGGGPQLASLVDHFVTKGHEVSVINQDLNYCKTITRKFDIRVINGDASNPEVLDDAEITYADLVIVMKDRDSENFVICEMLNLIYKIQNIIAVVHNPQNIDVFMQLGVENVISISEMIASATEQKMNIEEITDIYNYFADSDTLSVLEIEIGDAYRSINKTIQELDIPADAIISCIIREESTIIPKPKTKLLEGDRLLVNCLSHVKTDLIREIKG